jgi:hypothetical protein
MANRIIRRDQFFTIYCTTDAGPPIPYGAVQHDGDRRSDAFVDLRGRPDLVPGIYEADGKPGLVALLTEINGVSSDVMSLGCENAICPVAPEHQAARDAVCYVGSYVDLAFRDTAHAAEHGRCLDLASQIADTAALTASDRTIYEIGIEPMQTYFEQPGCFSLMLKICTFGRDEGEAWRLWDGQCHKLAGVFEGCAADAG